MTLLRLVLTLIASYTMHICVNATQTQESRPLIGYAIQVIFVDNVSLHSPMSGPELKGRTDFTLAPWRLIKRAEKDSDQVSMVLLSAAFDGGVWKNLSTLTTCSLCCH